MDIEISTAECGKLPFSFNICEHKYNFKKVNYPVLYENLLRIDWILPRDFTDVNAALEYFYSIIYDVVAAQHAT